MAAGSVHLNLDVIMAKAVTAVCLKFDETWLYVAFQKTWPILR
jgi:hypothetical protein